MKRARTHIRVYIIFITVFLVTGIGLFAAGDYYRDLSRQLTLFNKLYKELVVNYVDQVDPDALIDAGIEGMLKTLDPYTVYLEKEGKHNIQTLTNGKYGGVGIRLGVRRDSLTVIAPIQGSPAQRAGIQAGDRIIQIDTIRAPVISLSRAANLLRGVPGTTVTLTIRRPGIEERIPFTLTRDEIVIHDLAYADLLGDNVAYYKLTSFSKNSSRELRQSLERYNPESLSGLILDLRDNPGGLLAAALDVLDLFLVPSTEMLSTRGRTEKSNQVYKANRPAIVPPDLPVAILVNSGSASASEIVAGVMQDLDRAIIIGEESFGKGLVQTVVELESEAAVKITTAKYYIPSGRLIQKHDYTAANVVNDPGVRDSIFFTQNHRKVYGGGGITPDIITPDDTLAKPVRSILAKNYFFDFAIHYHNLHSNLDWPFEVTNAITDEFFMYLKQKAFVPRTNTERNFNKFAATLDSATIHDHPQIAEALHVLQTYFDSSHHWSNHPAMRDQIRQRLQSELAQAYGGQQARITAGLASDRAVRMAIRQLQNQQQYLQKLGYAVTYNSMRE